ncbi:MAG: hypothetical protein U5N86_10395 [Planctomycetota bacterium]|nr:hypothetical protein [Planctomycetota bacterium]
MEKESDSMVLDQMALEKLQKEDDKYGKTDLNDGRHYVLGNVLICSPSSHITG